MSVAIFQWLHLMAFKSIASTNILCLFATPKASAEKLHYDLHAVSIKSRLFLSNSVWSGKNLFCLKLHCNKHSTINKNAQNSLTLSCFASTSLPPLNGKSGTHGHHWQEFAL
jgi:hypothetical protein